MITSIYRVMCASIVLAAQLGIAMEPAQRVTKRGPRVFDLTRITAISALVAGQVAVSTAQATSRTATDYRQQPELPEMIGVCACLSYFVCVAGSTCGCCTKSH